MPEVKNIFLHCSATGWGEVLEFDRWHRQRGWSGGIGYHYVILNGRPFRDVGYWPFLDGQIQPGRPLDDDPIFEAHEVGAHVAGRNAWSIGVCLVGRDKFTDSQLKAAKELLLHLKDHFGLDIKDILGHYEAGTLGEQYATDKTCPNVPMDDFRAYLYGTIGLTELQAKIKEHVRKIYP